MKAVSNTKCRMRMQTENGGGAGLPYRCNTPAALFRVPVSVLLAAVLACAVSCGTQRKLAAIRDGSMAAAISLPERDEQLLPQFDSLKAPHGDTLKVTGLDGREVLIMKAVRDSETGEMVAVEQLSAAVVTARFRNVAERRGRIDLAFQVIVPSGMRDSRWQLRFHPEMHILGDTVRMEDVIVTGEEYRRVQLRGYEQYRMFLSRIAGDSDSFIDSRSLEIFIERNFPELFAFRSDSSCVSDAEFGSVFGLNADQVREHYTDRIALARNERRKDRKDLMFEKYVKSPIISEGVRLDTVIRNSDGDFVYDYVQTIDTRPGLRKADIVLSGEIFEQDDRIYTMPPCEPLTFYISSVSAFVDGTERYRTMIVSRNAEANATADIDFKSGSADLDESLSRNRAEMDIVRLNIRSLLTNETFELDSIIVVANASPEGNFRDNAVLCSRRAASACGYFADYVRYLRDSLRREAGYMITLGSDSAESGMVAARVPEDDIPVISRSGGENWNGLEMLVEGDTLMTEAAKERFRDLLSVEDKDEREKLMRNEGWYPHVRDVLYPRLRTVRFDFRLHRRGMIKDTVHTTVLDSTYMEGVQAIRNRDYERAVELLAPYQDYNAAVALVALDRNASALAILKDCPVTAPVNYMLALVHSRMGDETNAVQCYIRSCEQDRSFVYRGNLDPEIAALIRKYDLNAEPDDEFSDLGY